MTAKQTPLVDLLRIHADDIHSAHGHNKSSTLLSQAADHIVALEAERDQLRARADEIMASLARQADELHDERDQLRAELAAFRCAVEHVTENGKTVRSLSASEGWAMIHAERLSDLEICEEQLTSLRAELAEARKPDCNMCAYRLACRTLIKDDCLGGDQFLQSRDPLRLYEKEVIATESAATATRLWGGDAHEM